MEGSVLLGLEAFFFLVATLLVLKDLVQGFFDQLLFDFQFVVGAEVCEDDEERDEDADQHAAEEDEAGGGDSIRPEEETHSYPEEDDYNQKTKRECRADLAATQLIIILWFSLELWPKLAELPE